MNPTLHEPHPSPASPHPPRGSPSLTGVLIFVGIAVMISLVYTQMREAHRRSRPALPILAQAPPLSGYQTSQAQPAPETPWGEGHLWLVHFAGDGRSAAFQQADSVLQTLTTSLDSFGDKKVRIARLYDNPPHTPAPSPTFPSSPGRLLELWPPETHHPPALATKQRFANLAPSPSPSNQSPQDTPESRLYLVDFHGQIRACRNAWHPNVVADLLQDLGALTRESITATPTTPPIP